MRPLVSTLAKESNVNSSEPHLMETIVAISCARFNDTFTGVGDGIRTHTCEILSLVPLPLRYTNMKNRDKKFTAVS